MIVAIGASSAARPARADEATSVKVSYFAPRGCPDSNGFTTELGAKSPLIRFTNDVDALRTLVVRVELRGGRHVGRLVLRERDGRETERTVEGVTCNEVVTGLVFVAALALDSAAASSDPGVPATLTPTTPSPSASVEPIGSGEETMSPNPARRPFTVNVGLDAQALTGPVPEVRFGPAVFVELASASLTIFAPSGRLRVAHAEGSKATFGHGLKASWTAGSLDLCPLAWTVGSFRMTPCVRAEVGVLDARGTGISPSKSSSRPWLATGLGGRALISVVEPVALGIEGSFMVPFVRDTYVVELGAPVTPLFRAPAIGWSAAFGLAVRIW